MRSPSNGIAVIAIISALVLPFAAAASTNPVELNAGSMVTSSINQTIDSGSAHAGDKFTMTVMTPYPGNNAAYDNAKLFGHVTRVVSAGQGQNPVLEFNIDRMVLANGRQADVSMLLQSQATQRHNMIANTAVTALGGMIVGNMIGKSLFKSNLGGAAGLIAGALYANNKRANVSLRQGSVVVTEVRQSVALVYPKSTAKVSRARN
ncbi:MAG TPA: hypothetical protein VKT51_05010 [Candidatus Eremiobacteraceae bacterium]|nr:hypothetical protein [Candidatus Eremiobacteraceae bacterium]